MPLCPAYEFAHLSVIGERKSSWLISQVLHGVYRSLQRRLRGWIGLEDVYKALRRTDIRWRRPEPDLIVRRRRGGNETRDRAAERPGRSGRPSYGGAVLPRPATIPRSHAWSTSQPCSGHRVSPSPRSSRIAVPGAPVPPILRRRTAICLSTGASSPPPSRPDVGKEKAASWPTLQVPWGVGGAQRQSATRVERPSELVPDRDPRQMIPPAQRAMVQARGLKR